jgi:hypothetical protein
MITFELHFLVADELADAVYLLGGGHLAVLEAEAPGIDQRGYRHVEGTAGLLGDMHA